MSENHENNYWSGSWDDCRPDETLTQDQLKARIHDGLKEFVDDVAAECWQAKVCIECAIGRAETAESALAELRARITALRDEWERSADSVEREIDPGGIRAKYPEGPRYGIAAVRSCAEAIAALLDPPVRKEP